MKFSLSSSAATIIIGLGVWIICNNALEIICSTGCVQSDSWLPILLLETGRLGRKVALAMAIISGIISLRRNGLSFTRIIIPTLGMAAIIYFMIQNLMVYNLENEFYNDMGASRDEYTKALEKIQKNMLQDARLGKFYAMLKFREEGILVEYHTTYGKPVLYSPIQEDIDSLKSEIRHQLTNEFIKEKANDLLESFFGWMLFALTCILVGLLIPINQMSIIKNQTDSDNT